MITIQKVEKMLRIIENLKDQIFFNYTGDYFKKLQAARQIDIKLTEAQDWLKRLKKELHY